MKRNFGVLGGGKRYAELCRLLEGDGHTVFPFGVTEAGTKGQAATAEERREEEAALGRALSAETVLLPLPLCGGSGRLNCPAAPLEAEALFSRMKPGQTVLAGQIPAAWYQAARRHGLRPVDYLRCEALAVANAAATADAALYILMERLEASLSGKRCLVLGFGRVGKLLCHRLRGLCAVVAAAARKPEDLAWIRAYGFQALETGKLAGKLHAFDVICNTVPAPVLDRAALPELSPACLLLELASRPGMDAAAAEALGLSLVRAGGLPGRVVPRTAAAAIRDTVYEILREGEPS